MNTANIIPALNTLRYETQKLDHDWSGLSRKSSVKSKTYCDTALPPMDDQPYVDADGNWRFPMKKEDT